MLYEYQLANFKAFSDPATLLLRPITLIYGPNSAGKSSIIQSLMLLKQTLQDSESFKAILKTRGSLVDLGSYREFVHLHDVSRSFKFKFAFSLDQPDRYEYDSLFPEAPEEIEHLGISIVLSYDGLNRAIVISAIEIFLGDESLPFATYETQDSRLLLTQINSEHHLWQDWWVRAQSMIPRSIIKQVNEILQRCKVDAISLREKRKLTEALQKRSEAIRILLLELQQDKAKIDKNIAELEEEREVLENDQMRLRAEFLEPLNKEIYQLRSALDTLQISKVTLSDDQEQVEDETQSLEAKTAQKEQQLEQRRGEYEEIPIRLCVSNINQEKSKQNGIANEIEEVEICLTAIEVFVATYQAFKEHNTNRVISDIVKIAESSSFSFRNFLPISSIDREDSVIDREVEHLSSIYADAFDLNFFPRITIFVSSLLQDLLVNTRYIGPLRDYPERYYIFSEGDSEDVGKSGSGMGGLLFRDPEFLEKINSQLVQFELGYELQVTSFNDGKSSDTSDVYALRLMDKHKKVQVNLLDVGFGISQVLPVIVQSMFAHRKTIIIEQPEIHIHPRLQTRLGSLFAECIRPPFENQFVIETHSEHLMLRLQKLIRKGELNADDISVIYIDRTTDGTRCLQLRLDTEGDFIDEWPGGFFEEDFNEIFE
jgi:AAA15 family ATPase/GTPase